MRGTCCNHEPDEPVGFISQVHGGQSTTSSEAEGGGALEKSVGRELYKQVASQFFFCMCCCHHTLANVNAIEKTLDDLLTLMRKKKVKASTLATTFSPMNDISRGCVL